MVLTVSRTPPEAFFLETTFEDEFDFMRKPGGVRRARSSQALSGESSALPISLSGILGRDGRERGDHHDCLGKRRLVGQTHIEPCCHSGWGDRCQAMQGAAGEPHPGLTRRQVDDPEIAPEHALAKAGAQCLRRRLFRGEPPRIARHPRDAAAVTTEALRLGEDAVEKTVAESLDRALDAADVYEVAAEAEDHRLSRAPARPS